MTDEKQQTFTVALPSLEEMLKCGVHFGHQTSKRHPKMAPFIFTKRNGIHVIDLEKSHAKLQEALDFVYQIAYNGGVILFVGSKKQARENVKANAIRCGMPYVVDRWIGGIFTNFDNVGRLIKKLDQLEADEASGAWEKYKKSEQVRFKKEQQKLLSFVGGIRTISKLPKALFVVDIKKEKTAVAEANKKNIAIIAMTDTNVNPDLVQYPIPANDDAASSISLMATIVADVILEAKAAAAASAVVTQK